MERWGEKLKIGRKYYAFRGNFFTFDIDWTPDWMIEEVAEKLIKYAFLFNNVKKIYVI